MFRYAIFILFLSLSQLSFSSSFKAIASGSGYDLWGVAKDGRVYYRSNKIWQEVKGQELNWISRIQAADNPDGLPPPLIKHDLWRL